MQWTRLRNGIALLLLFLAAFSQPWRADAARWDYTAEDTLAALKSASARARCVVGYETGFTYSPNLVGRVGEIGAVQLHPQGELLRFEAEGWGDPWSPYDAIAYLDYRLRNGGASAWSPVLRGLC